MQIGVLLRVVPEFEALLKVAEDGRSVEIEPKFTVNFFDLVALEEALRIKERYGGRVKVFSLCTPAMVETLRTAIAMGADDIVALLVDNLVDLDCYATARLLFEMLKKEGHMDIVLCGREAMDDASGMVGVMVAEFLGWPVVTYITKVEVFPENKKVVVERDSDDQKEIVEVGLPVLLTAQKGLTEPRTPTVFGVMRAMKTQIPCLDFKENFKGYLGLEEIIRVKKKRFEPVSTSRRRIVMKGEPSQIVKDLVKVLKSEIRLF